MKTQLGFRYKLISTTAPASEVWAFTALSDQAAREKAGAFVEREGYAVDLLRLYVDNGREFWTHEQTLMPVSR